MLKLNDRMVGKANRILGMLRRTFESRNPKLWKDLPICFASKAAFGVCNANVKYSLTK